jgi:uncharacterized OsmC-like protein
MPELLIRSISEGRCCVEHQPSGAFVETDLPPEYGGAGRSFSGTDLLAAALGVCIATNIDSVAVRHNVPLDALTIRVKKELAQSPKRVARLEVTISVAADVSPDVLARLERAAASCAVGSSLHPEVAVVVQFDLAPQDAGT